VVDLNGPGPNRLEQGATRSEQLLSDGRGFPIYGSAVLHQSTLLLQDAGQVGRVKDVNYQTYLVN
jgi:hypothetical protein